MFELSINQLENDLFKLAKDEQIANDNNYNQIVYDGTSINIYNNSTKNKYSQLNMIGSYNNNLNFGSLCIENDDIIKTNQSEISLFYEL